MSDAVTYDNADAVVPADTDIAAQAGVLTPADLKAIENAVIHAITSQPTQDVKRAFLAWLTEEGVLTKDNFGAFFHADPGVYARIAETTWEQVEKAKHEP
jgi:hypothetical protein